eukprot:9213378-Pyramimonas_sp.AAC.1
MKGTRSRLHAMFATWLRISRISCSTRRAFPSLLQGEVWSGFALSCGLRASHSLLFSYSVDRPLGLLEPPFLVPAYAVRLPGASPLHTGYQELGCRL